MTNYDIFIYLAIINLITFICFGLDKYKAITTKRRISEKNLHTFSFIGGIIGAILGMLIFRHKINKVKFVVIEVLIFIFWISLVIGQNIKY